MTSRILLLAGAAVTLGAGTTCILYPGVANAQTATGQGATASGNNGTATGANSSAFGDNSTATGALSSGLGDNSTATGAHSSGFGDNGTATGANSDATGVNSTATGELSIGLGDNSTANGANSEGFGEDSTAIGASSLGFGDHSTATGYSTLAVGLDSSAFGDQALAGGTYVNGVINTFSNEHTTALGASAQAGAGASGQADATAVGYGAQANVLNGTSLGANSQVTGENAIALGQGSVADQANTVSVGSAGNERRIVNVAAGTVAAGSTDAVNGDQLYGVNQTATTALAHADTAQGTANNALAHADTAQGTANIALSRADAAQGTANTALSTANVAVAHEDALSQSTAAALGGGAAYDPATGSVSAPSYSIGGTSYNNVGAAFGAVDTRLDQLSGHIDGVIDLAYDIREEERRGIAAAVAIATAPMPSEPGRVAWAVNTAIFHGELAYGGSLAARLPTSVPLAVTAGFAYARGGDNVGRVGLAGEF